MTAILYGIGAWFALNAIGLWLWSRAMPPRENSSRTIERIKTERGR